MYRPAVYRENETAELLDMIRNQTFATLVSAADGVPVATHLPLLLRHGDAGELRLIGHMARANPHWRELADRQAVLAVFLGPHAYISPRWYQAEPDVPTWNYSAVHAHGHWRHVGEEAETRSILNATVRYYEDRMHSRWSADDLDESLVDRFVAGVVAFEIAVDALEGVKKMGQDKQRVDIEAVACGLARERGPGQGRESVATMMSDAQRRRRGKDE